MNKNDPSYSYSISLIFAQRPAKRIDTYKAVLFTMLNQAEFTLPKELRHDYKVGQAPEITFLRYSHRSLLKEWLGVPVEQKFSIKRWGLSRFG